MKAYCLHKHKTEYMSNYSLYTSQMLGLKDTKRPKYKINSKQF